MYKYLLSNLREHIFIFLTVAVFSLLPFSKTLSSENVFVIDDIKVEGNFEINFSRDKYINKAFLKSYEVLMSKILLSSDFNKINDLELIEIKKLINSFQILEETYKKEKYKATFKIFYNDLKVKKLLGSKNISFSQPKNISALFYPVLIVDDEIKDFRENFFYNKWNKIKIKNELINFILPIEDLEDLQKIKKIKNKVEELNLESIVKTYNTNNYVFMLMQNQDKKLNIYLKTNFNNNQTSKNISYKFDNISDEIKLEEILKDLKMQITDIWKGENIINLAIPLTIQVKVNNKNLTNLDNLKNIFYKINIIDQYSVEEFNINYTYFKIYYYGNPKKLKTELAEFGYQLKNDQGNWEIYDG